MLEASPEKFIEVIVVKNPEGSTFQQSVTRDYSGDKVKRDTAYTVDNKFGNFEYANNYYDDLFKDEFANLRTRFDEVLQKSTYEKGNPLKFKKK